MSKCEKLRIKTPLTWYGVFFTGLSVIKAVTTALFSDVFLDMIIP